MAAPRAGGVGRPRIAARADPPEQLRDRQVPRQRREYRTGGDGVRHCGRRSEPGRYHPRDRRVGRAKAGGGAQPAAAGGACRPPEVSPHAPPGRALAPAAPARRPRRRPHTTYTPHPTDTPRTPRGPPPGGRSRWRVLRRARSTDCAVGSGEWAEPPHSPWTLRRRVQKKAIFWPFSGPENPAQEAPRGPSGASRDPPGGLYPTPGTGPPGPPGTPPLGRHWRCGAR